MFASLLAAPTNIFLTTTGIGGSTAVEDGKGVLDSTLGKPITVFFAAIGTLISVYVIYLFIKCLGKGKTVDAIKTAIGGIVIAALCFNLSFVQRLTTGAWKVVDKGMATIEELWEKSCDPAKDTNCTPQP